MTRIQGTRSMLLVSTLVLAVLALIVAGCGGDSGSAYGTKTYKDAKYDYSFQYPSGWSIEEGGSADVSAGGSAGASVGVYDPKGAVADKTYIDMVQISVYELNVTVSDTNMDDIKAEVQNVLASLEGQAGDLKTVEPLGDTTVGGMKGYKVTYKFAKNGAPVTSTLYFLFSGNREYQVTVQAADSNWDAKQKDFEALLKSFQPAPAAAK